MAQTIAGARAVNTFSRLLAEATTAWGAEVARNGVGGAEEQIKWHEVVHLRKRLLEETEIGGRW